MNNNPEKTISKSIMISLALRDKVHLMEKDRAQEINPYIRLAIDHYEELSRLAYHLYQKDRNRVKKARAQKVSDSGSGSSKIADDKHKPKC